MCPVAADKYPSSYFFIEGVCYNDMRKPGAKVLSDNVVAWAPRMETYVQPNCFFCFAAAAAVALICSTPSDFHGRATCDGHPSDQPPWRA